MSNDAHPNRKRQAYRHETANEMGTPKLHMEGRFARIPSLKSHEKDAAAFLAEYSYLTEDRKLMIHALWENFQLQPPLAVNVLNIKAVSGTQNVIGFRA
jgi:hypothetical protein